VAQIPVLAVVGLTRDVPVAEIVAGSLVLLVAAVGGMAARGQLVAAGAVVLGLVTAAGILVRYLDGSPESFFAFFIALVAISFYQQTGLLVVGLIYVATFHVFALLSLYRESLIFRAGVVDMPLPMAAVALDVILVMLLIAGWRFTARADARRLAVEDMFRIGFERSSTGMATLTPSGEFIHANAALTNILGPVNGATVRSVIHADDLDQLGRLWEDMGQAESRTAETWLRFRAVDGQAIWARTSLCFVRGTRTRPASLLLQLEDDGAGHRELDRLQDRLAGRDEFVAAIAEDMKGPIQTVLDLTTQTAVDPIDLHRIVRRIDDEVRHVASIVEDLRVSARAGKTPFVARSVDARLVCREALADVPGAGELAVDAGSELLWADPGLTIKILDNLVANAVRYGGRLVRLEVTASGPDTVISVVDDGPAVPVAERDRMFDADLQSTTQPTRPAAVGLSLTVARRLARQMDGEVTYRRTGDGRNVFELRLPAEAVHAAPDSEVVLDPIRIPA
jgi:PAS domain S-box-containing protein